MLLNIILFVSTYPVVLIMYFVLKYSGKNRNGTVFGLCVPKDEALAKEFYKQVQEKQVWYQRRMRTTLILLLLVSLVSFATPYFSIQFTIWMLWLLLGIVFLELPCILVNRELKVWKKSAVAKMRLPGQLAEESADAEMPGAKDVHPVGMNSDAEKAETEWKKEERKKSEQKKAGQKEAGRGETWLAATSKSENVRLIELSEAGQVRKTKLLPFLLPTFISMAAVAAYYLLCEDSRGQKMTWVVFVLAIVTPMFYLAAGWMDKQRTAVVSYDSEVNLNYARAKKQIWNRLWLLCAWLNTVFTAFAALVLRNEKITALWLLWGTVAYVAVTMIFVLAAVRKVNRLEQCYEKKIDPLLNEDDDDCWIWGMLYYNKADKRTLVETRVGYGTATNMATPLGKGLMAFAALALLSLPIVCVWMILLEFTPIRLMVQQDYLVAEQLKTDYRIAVEDIEELELVQELPELSKNAGTGMDNLYKGNWHILYAGDCEVFLNPENGLFIKFMADGELYYMSAEDDGKTQEVYEKLKGWGGD